MSKLVLRFLKGNPGATAIEYSLIICSRDHRRVDPLRPLKRGAVV